MEFEAKIDKIRSRKCGIEIIGCFNLVFENSKILKFVEILLYLLNIAENKQKKFWNLLENIIFVYSLDLTMILWQ